jgi:O-antigen ligase
MQVVRLIEVLVVFSFLIINVFTTEKSIRRMFFAIMVGGFIASLVGIGQFVIESDISGESHRVYGFLGGGYGSIVSSVLICCVGILLYEKTTIIRTFAYIIAPIAGIALIVSQTRAWIGAFILVLFFMLLLLNRKYLIRVMITIVSVVVFIVIFFLTDGFGLIDGKFFVEAIVSAFRFGKNVGQYSFIDVSLIMRLVVWTYSVGLFVANPIIGLGIGNLRFSTFIPPTLSSPSQGSGYVDNQYIMVFVETGIIGGFAWMWLYYNAIRIGSKVLSLPIGSNLKSVSFGLFGSLCIFLVGGIFWTITTYHELFVWMVLLISLLVCIKRITFNSSDGKIELSQCDNK